MALLGVTASEDALESAIEALGPTTAEDIDMNGMAHLGEEWYTTRNIIKAYPSQIYTQAAVEASIALHLRGVRPGQIKRITLYGHRNVAAGCSGICGGFQAHG